MRKKDSLLCKIALISCGYGIFSDSVIVPIFSKICADYPDTSTFLTNFILTGGYVFSLLSSLVSGFLLRYLSKRYLLIFGTISFTLGGVGAYFTSSMKFLAFCRILDGISDGVLTVAALSMITELYQEKTRAQMIGLYSAVSAAFGVMLSFFSGIIGDMASNWRTCFLLNLFSVISIILVFLAVPVTPKEKKTKTTPLWSVFRLRSVQNIYFEYFVSSALYCILFIFVDIYVQEKGFGSSTLSGTISAFGSIFTFLTGVTFAAIYVNVKKYVRFSCFLGLGTSFLLLFLAVRAIAAVLVFCMAAVFYSFLYSYYQMKIGVVAPKDDLDIYIGVLNAWYNVACFLSSYIPYSIMSFMKTNVLYHSFLPISAFLYLLGILYFFQFLTKKETV